MALSEKKKNELYEAVYNKVMNARVRLAVLLQDAESGKIVDDIMNELCDTAPESALKVFSPQKPKEPQ